MAEAELLDLPLGKGGTGCRFYPGMRKDRVDAELAPVWAVKDRHPLIDGHYLIVPKRPTADWFHMSAR